MNDAWDFIRKIYNLKCYDIEKIFNTDGGVYGVISSTIPIKDMIAKLEAYESEKQIKVGDVVEYNGKTGIVTKVDGERFYILWSGGIGDTNSRKGLKKTGKHIDISSILAEIGKE